MTNSQYGNYQTPSSRPPEPPYRTGSQQGYANANENTAPADQTPYGGEQQGYTGKDTSGFDVSGYSTNEETRFASNAAPTESLAENNSAPSAGYTENPNAFKVDDTQTMPRVENAYESYQAQNPTASHANFTQQHAVETAPKKSGGAGKTFLFGFLGALVACAIAFGCFAAWNGGRTAESSAITSLGSSDSSVINAVEEGQTLAEAVAAKALPSVVAIYNYQEQSSSYGYGNTGSSSDSLSASGMGSGVVISEDGYIVTNYHVVEDASKITVKVNDEEREATYVGGDSSSDVAVLKVDNTEGLTAADIGDSDSLVIGEWVMTVGAPLGLEQSVATGVVSATNRSTIMDNSSSDAYSYFYQNTTPEYTYYPNMIQTDAVINPGNSGGALVDADGKLIGINTMISSYSGDYAGVGFAIPVNYAIGIAEQIIAGKTPTHALLGVSISSVNSNTAQRYGFSTDTGAYINAVSDGSGAADAGLQVGDIITQIDDSKISSTTDVTLKVREHNPGDTVTVTVNRRGETQQYEVVLGSDENSSTGSSQGQGNGSGGNGSQGQGNGNGSNGNGYNMNQLEELLKMLGM